MRKTIKSTAQSNINTGEAWTDNQQTLQTAEQQKRADMLQKIRDFYDGSFNLDQHHVSPYYTTGYRYNR